ncbi:MAG: septum formation inhibitor Maf [Clostridia bacterium]|nr:septum formation inhibitor Maf [Clostridia bacterium]
MKLVLASGSPRRRKLLTEYGYDFTVRTGGFDESRVSLEDPAAGVAELALGKAEAARETLRAEGVQTDDLLFLGSDTVVVKNGLVLGKPEDEADAFRMLRALSGQTHQVVTGVALLHPDGDETFTVTTDVEFYDLSDEEIRDYIATGEPLDKAGAYGIQGLGGVLVRSIHGDYYTVVGLPLAEVVRRLRNYGIRPGSFTKNSTSV